jgi:hypothetical protein
MLQWLCVLIGTAILFAAVYGGMKLFGKLAMERDAAEREKLQQEWKARAAARRGEQPGEPPPPQQQQQPPDAAQGR